MAIYAIGDVQGCYAELMDLLHLIQFDELKDCLWLTGDLVNRGRDSLAVLRFIKSLGPAQQVVLGNHDLHLLAIAYGAPSRAGDTLDAILTAPDRDVLIDWLRSRKLFHYDAEVGYALTHAGLAPSWTLEKAQALAEEVTTVLQGPAPQSLLNHLYGNKPDQWDDHLTGVERWRVIINYMTRMRFCYPDGRLALDCKGSLKDTPPHLVPWFDMPHRVTAKDKILFGHWAALGGIVDVPNVYALDTGCVWGNALTAMRLDDEKRFSVPYRSGDMP